jgi:L-lysine exporter family protein LysE/ArgO
MDMTHVYFFGLLIGWGVAVPIGPMNLEIIRRNLSFGLRYGLSFGTGIVSADLSYLLLLNLGILTVLAHHPMMLTPIALAGSVILFWFGLKTLRMPPLSIHNNPAFKQLISQHIRDGYLLTLLSPFTILFWASMSSQIAVSGSGPHRLLIMSLGVMTGVCSWMFGLNIALHLTRHRISPRVMHALNRTGGVILIGFACFGLWRGFQDLHNILFLTK